KTVPVHVPECEHAVYHTRGQPRRGSPVVPKPRGGCADVLHAARRPPGAQHRAPAALPARPARPPRAPAGEPRDAHPGQRAANRSLAPATRPRSVRNAAFTRSPPATAVTSHSVSSTSPGKTGAENRTESNPTSRIGRRLHMAAERTTSRYAPSTNSTPGKIGN